MTLQHSLLVTWKEYNTKLPESEKKKSLCEDEGMWIDNKCVTSPQTIKQILCILVQCSNSKAQHRAYLQ